MTQLHLAPSAPETAPGQTRGACPTLHKPMQTGDGLLARLRPMGGEISPIQLHAIAALATRHGNGQIEITARGNLQVRGLQASTVPNFAAAVEDLISIDTGVPVEISPLAGLDPQEIADAKPIADAIRTAIASSTLTASLGPKVTVIIDGGGSISLSGLNADIGVRAVQPKLWSIQAGRHPLGWVTAVDAASSVVALLAVIAALGPTARGRDLDAATARQCLKSHLIDQIAPRPPVTAAPPQLDLCDGRIAVAIALPFGAASAWSMMALSQAAHAAQAAELRLAPHHGLIALCPSAMLADQFRHAAIALGFLTDPNDPRRAISACIGSDGCASGLLPARQIAETLAGAEAEFFDGSFALHVSGCSKGCAHPAPSLLAFVGAKAGSGLVLDGSAKSPPMLTLHQDDAAATLHHLATLWRDERTLGESVASCFKRLGAARIAAAVRQG